MSVRELKVKHAILALSGLLGTSDTVADLPHSSYLPATAPQTAQVFDGISIVLSSNERYPLPTDVREVRVAHGKVWVHSDGARSLLTRGQSMVFLPGKEEAMLVAVSKTTLELHD